MKRVNEILLKYVDYLTLAEAINLPKNGVAVSEDVRPLPDLFHACDAKSGGELKDVQTTKLNERIRDANEIKINYK